MNKWELNSFSRFIVDGRVFSSSSSWTVEADYKRVGFMLRMNERERESEANCLYALESLRAPRQKTTHTKERRESGSVDSWIDARSTQQVPHYIPPIKRLPATDLSCRAQHHQSVSPLSSVIHLLVPHQQQKKKSRGAGKRELVQQRHGRIDSCSRETTYHSTALFTLSSLVSSLSRERGPSTWEPSPGHRHEFQEVSSCSTFVWNTYSLPHSLHHPIYRVVTCPIALENLFFFFLCHGWSAPTDRISL